VCATAAAAAVAAPPATAPTPPLPAAAGSGSRASVAEPPAAGRRCSQRWRRVHARLRAHAAFPRHHGGGPCRGAAATTA